MTRIYTLSLLVVLISFSCQKEQQFLDVPATYDFTRNSASTVSFTGQSARIAMAEATMASMINWEKSKEDVINMFNNQERPFDSEELNNNSKNIRSKVAASTDYFQANTLLASEIKQDFQTWIASQFDEVAPNIGVMASKGVAGQIADGLNTRYVNAKGFEYNQIFGKSLIGALMLDQMVNHYLSVNVLDAGLNRSNNDELVLVEGKPYTAMEHYWDEAYGYVFGASVDATNPLLTLGDDDSFFNKYLAKADQDPDFTGLAQNVFDAFKRGRAAIVAGEYDERNAQAEILRELLSKVIAIRTVHYLQQGKLQVEANQMGTAFHELSEAYGFLYSLQFTREPFTSDPYLTRDEVTHFLHVLEDGNGLWDIEYQQVDEISETIAEVFGFTVAEALEE